jgi:hypothetical protein
LAAKEPISNQGVQLDVTTTVAMLQVKAKIADLIKPGNMRDKSLLLYSSLLFVEIFKIKK